MADEHGDSSVAELQSSSTPTDSPELTPEQLAQKPEIASAFRDVFGGGDDDGSADAGTSQTTRQESGASRRQRERETSEELEGRDGADEADDGVEPKADDKSDGDDAGSDERTTTVDQQDQQQRRQVVDSKDAKATTLDATLRFAAERAGWSAEEIQTFWDESPDIATRTFDKLYGSYNDLTDRYAQLGRLDNQQQAPLRQQAAQGQQATQQPGQKQEQGKAFDLLEAAFGERLSTLSDRYGSDFIEDFARPLATTMQSRLQEMTAPLAEMQQYIERQQKEAVANEVGSFFSTLPDEFHDLYGNKTKVDDGQSKSRDELYTMADQIRSGARLSGLDMTVTEALGRAMLSHSSSHLQALERKRLTEKVRQRSRSITQRPTQRRQASTPAGAGNKETAMRAYAEKAAELGIDV